LLENMENQAKTVGTVEIMEIHKHLQKHELQQ